MIIIETFKELEKWKSERFVATIGNFDGLHIAHQKIIHSVVREAKKKKMLSMVITFRNHPLQTGPRKKKPVLTAHDHKMLLLQRAGVDVCFVFSFNERLKKMKPIDFLEKTLFARFPLHALYVGYNFRFGKDRAGTTKMIEHYAKKYAVRCHIEKRVVSKNAKISSSRIRELITKGYLKQAAELLGKRYSVFADVVRGRGRGSLLGFPTANLDVHSEVLPPDGVYIVKVAIWNVRLKRLAKGIQVNETCVHKNLIGVMNLGLQPTFDDAGCFCPEVHILNLSENVRNKLLEVTFFKRIRAEKRFVSAPQLCLQIGKDIDQAQEFFKEKRK